MVTTPLLTIGMAAYKNPADVRWTLMSLLMDHKTAIRSGQVEIVVVDNFGCEVTKAVTEKTNMARYVLANEVQGTAYPRDRLFREAKGRFTCCIDSHIKIESDPPAVARLLKYLDDNPDMRDLLTGPLVTESGGIMWTEFRDTDPDGNELWGDGMHGKGHARAFDGDEPFEIRAMGLGLFCCRTDAFLKIGGFNRGFRGFGGEECYLHEKFRREGGKCLCLPWLRWWHAFRFHQEKPPYQALRLDMFRNYLIGRKELGLDARPVIQHYSQRITPAKLRHVIMEVYCEADGKRTSGGGSWDSDGGSREGDNGEEPSDEAARDGVQPRTDEGARACDGDGRRLVCLPGDNMPTVRSGVHVAGSEVPGNRASPASGKFVSCICCTYGRCPKWQHLIEETIESFLRQSYPAELRELIVLNDCADQKLECMAPGVRIINRQERYPSLGEKVNGAIEEAVGDLILPWDDDDINLRDRISQAVERIGDSDWWNPRGTWYLAEVAGGPEGTGLHHEHHHGYCLNASAFTRAGWNKIGRFQHVGAVDKDTDAKLHRVNVAPPLPSKRPDLWQYIYRWGVSPCHISGGGDLDRSYAARAAVKFRVGTFVLKPHWRIDYQKLVEFQLEEIGRYGSEVRASG